MAATGHRDCVAPEDVILPCIDEASSCSQVADVEEAAAARDCRTLEADGNPLAPLSSSGEQPVGPLQSSVSFYFYGQSEHGLPFHVIWSIVVATSCSVAAMNLGMVVVGLHAVDWKFETVQIIMGESGVVQGTLALIGICCLFAGASAALVIFGEPLCAGSGIPEVKGYLNGNGIPHLFSVEALAVRVLGVVLATAAGFPIGREGPMVCIGGTLGYGVVHLLAAPHFRRFVRMQSSTSASLLQEERFENAKRIGCVIGGAAGIAVAFNSPIGGILYLLEEVTVTAWVPELTFRSFVCAVVAAISSKALLDASGLSVHHLVIFEDAPDGGQREWEWVDAPILCLLAVGIAVGSVVFSNALGFVWSTRRQLYTRVKSMRRRQGLRLLECMAVAALCAAAFGLLPLLAPCVPLGDHAGDDLSHDGAVDEHSADEQHAGDHHRRLSDSLHFIQHVCPDDSISEVASLLLNGAEGSVKLLFSRRHTRFQAGGLLLALCAYLPLAAAMPGLMVPMGAFVPSMLIGALVGRLVGELVTAHGGGFHLADPGVYALVGSAAMLGGFTHMTLAVVVLLVEAAHDLTLVAPLMMSVGIAHLVASHLCEHAYDEFLILQKGVPFLEAEVPHTMDCMSVTARQVCKRPRAHALLPEVAQFSEIVEALNAAPDLSYFPVVSDGMCVGVVTRTRLLAATRAFIGGRSSAPSRSERGEAGYEIGHVRSEEATQRGAMRALRVRRTSFSGSQAVPVHRLMDPSPIRIVEDMPIQRFYPLFAEAHFRVACVVKRTGEFCGVIDRSVLMSVPGTPEDDPGSRVSGFALAGSPRGSPPAGKSLSLLRDTHRQLPSLVVFAMLLLTPVSVAATNYVMVALDGFLVQFKFGAVTDVIEQHGPVLGALLLASICSMFALMSSTLVTFAGPSCAGSGLPEAKGYLNGNTIPDLFLPRVWLVRVICIVLATAAGFPIGREGPMVCIGGSLGYGIVHLFASPYYRRWVMDSATMVSASVDERGSAKVVIEEERFANAKKNGCILGAAAGIAVAFNAPIGGILYMFEEVTATSWSPATTFRALLCTTLACMISLGFLDFSNSDVHRLLIYGHEIDQSASWNWIDMPFFFILASAGGLLSVAFARGLLLVWAHRNSHQRRPLAKLLECTLYAACVALVFALVPLVAGCTMPNAASRNYHADWLDEESVGHSGASIASAASAASVASGASGASGASSASGHHRRLSSSLSYNQYTCTGEDWNEMATLLLNGAEGAVKHLFSRTLDRFGLGSLLATLFVYSGFAVGMPGLSLPMGMFVPSMLMGGLLGRFMGEAVDALDVGTAHAGMYAIVGSAAMLGGFTHMTMAVVVLLIEAAHDLSLVPILMFSVTVARFWSKAFDEHGFDEVLILKKGVPFLDSEVPEEMRSSRVTAWDILSKVPEKAVLPALATPEMVDAALRSTSEISAFPVARREAKRGGDEGVTRPVLIGLVTRARLELALQTCGFTCREGAKNPLSWSRLQTPQTFRDHGHLAQEDSGLRLRPVISDLCRPTVAKNLDAGPPSALVSDPVEPEWIPLYKIMDPAPFVLQEDMPVTRFYLVFAKAFAASALVTSSTGQLSGILSRSNLISATRAAHMSHGQHAPAAMVDDAPGGQRESRDGSSDEAGCARTTVEHQNALNDTMDLADTPSSSALPSFTLYHDSSDSSLLHIVASPGGVEPALSYTQCREPLGDDAVCAGRAEQPQQPQQRHRRPPQDDEVDQTTPTQDGSFEATAADDMQHCAASCGAACAAAGAEVENETNSVDHEKAPEDLAARSRKADPRAGMAENTAGRVARVGWRSLPSTIAGVLCACVGVDPPPID